MAASLRMTLGSSPRAWPTYLGPQTLGDAVRVRAHVLVGPEVEVPPHRWTVFRAKQRLDLGGELDGFVGSRHTHS